MIKRHVVVTGIGTVNALGNNVDEFWKNVKNGKTGIYSIHSFDTTDFKVKVAAEVKNLDIKDGLPVKMIKRSERFVHLALAAAKEAVEDSGLCMETEDSYRIGVCVGSGIVSACATGADSIGEAYHSILSGQSDVMAADGSDSIICPQGNFLISTINRFDERNGPGKGIHPF